MASISKIITFVPTLGKNNKKPKDEQFAVRLKAVKSSMKQTHLRKFIEIDPKMLMQKMMDSKQQTEIVELLKEHFVRFENFYVTEEVTEEQIGKEVHFKGEENPSTCVQEDVENHREYERTATIEDIFELGEYELAMEIFMHMIGSSQLRKPPVEKKTGDGGEGPTVDDEREDEEKNSESPSGTTLTPNVH
jgi:hypothetical protein